MVATSSVAEAVGSTAPIVVPPFVKKRRRSSAAINKVVHGFVNPRRSLARKYTSAESKNATGRRTRSSHVSLLSPIDIATRRGVSTARLGRCRRGSWCLGYQWRDVHRAADRVIGDAKRPVQFPHRRVAQLDEEP